VKDYFKRPQDVLNALRSLGSLGLSVSLPQTANGEMFFKVDRWELTVAEILELYDNDKLDRAGIRQFTAQRERDAA